MFICSALDFLILRIKFSIFFRNMGTIFWSPAFTELSLPWMRASTRTVLHWLCKYRPKIRRSVDKKQKFYLKYFEATGVFSRWTWKFKDRNFLSSFENVEKYIFLCFCCCCIFEWFSKFWMCHDRRDKYWKWNLRICWALELTGDWTSRTVWNPDRVEWAEWTAAAAAM